MAWSDAARAAALEARRARAQQTVRKSDLARATHKPSTSAKQALARESEAAVKTALRIKAMQGGNLHPVDAITKRGGRTFGVEVKTLMDNKNDKITMHPESVARKQQWARRERAALHTVVVDLRNGPAQMYHRSGIGSFRLGGLTPIASAAHLRRLVYGKGK